MQFSENPEIQARFEKETLGMTREQALDFIFSNDPKATELIMMEVGYRRDQSIAPKG